MLHFQNPNHTPQCFADHAGHCNLNSVADELLLLGLCAYQLVVGGETHDAFQFGNLQHSHLHIDQPVQRHELLYLHHDRAVCGIYLVDQRIALAADKRSDLLTLALRCDDVGRYLSMRAINVKHGVSMLPHLDVYCGFSR